MSTMTVDTSDFLDDAELVTESGDDSELVRKLRRTIKDQGKRFRETHEELNQLRGAQRSTSLTDILASDEVKGKPGWAKFYPRDKGTSKEDVLAWLKEHGADLGWTPPEVQESPEQAQRRQEMERTSGASAAGQTGVLGSMAAELDAAKTPDERRAIYRKHGAQKAEFGSEFS